MRQLQQRRSLALVVGCTQSKSLPAHDRLLVRNLPAGDNRCRLWTGHVSAATQTRPLRDLYKGQQWVASRALEQVAAASYGSVQLWIFSAGLGLRPADQRAPGYGASFTDGPDAVGSTVTERRAWWAQLQALGPSARIADVRASAEDMLVVLSPTYLTVLEPDLAGVADEGVAVLTSSTVRHPRGISTSGLQKALGGSDQTLNQRAAMRLIALAASGPIGARPVLDAYAAWAEPLRNARSYDRTSLEDDALRQIIKTQAARGPQSATGLLRQLRGDGFACEQRRFHRLYAETMGARHDRPDSAATGPVHRAAVRPAALPLHPHRK